jgi:hypothetical protein
MGRAAASRAEIRAALDKLEFHWGSAYHIAVADDMYTARRMDGKGGSPTDPLPDGLRLRIQADVAAWREQNPGGTSEDLVAAIGCQFHPDYGVVLRALLFAADRHQAHAITGATGSAAPGRGLS